MKFLLFQLKYDIGCIWRKWRKKLSGIFYIGGSDVFPPPLKTEIGRASCRERVSTTV